MADAPDPPRLSICLPTHDGRAGLLARALDSIVPQLEAASPGAVELCVSDNGSQDATQQLLADLAERLGASLRTARFEVNQGFTPNLLQVVELARGEHVWLMGSDDEVEPGGVALVLGILEAEPDRSGLTLNRRNIDDDDPGHEPDDAAHVLPPPGRTGYKDAAAALGELAMLQDYISTQVVRRTAWAEAVARIGPAGIAAGRNFPHMPILGAVIQADPRWRWVAEPVVRHRIGRASVTSTFDAGLSAYTAMVTDDRERIWRGMFGRRSSLYRRALRSAWTITAHPAAVAHLHRQADQTRALDLVLLRTMARSYWFLPAFWLTTVPVLLLPSAWVDGVLNRLRARKGLGPVQP